MVFHQKGRIPHGAPDFPSELPSASRTTDPDGIEHYPERKNKSLDMRSVPSELRASGLVDTVPDGWITRAVVQERLHLAGIEIDSRRIRHLCARNQLESVKVRNERNQPQHFINPVSLSDFIAENRPAGLSGSPLLVPDRSPDKEHEKVEATERGQSGTYTRVPESGTGFDVVPKAQLDQALETIEFLKEELRDSRQLKRDLKEISSEMLETFSLVASGRQLSQGEHVQRQREPVDVPQQISFHPKNVDRDGV